MLKVKKKTKTKQMTTNPVVSPVIHSFIHSSYLLLHALMATGVLEHQVHPGQPTINVVWFFFNSECGM